MMIVSNRFTKARHAEDDELILRYEATARIRGTNLTAVLGADSSPEMAFARLARRVGDDLLDGTEVGMYERAIGAKSEVSTVVDQAVTGLKGVLEDCPTPMSKAAMNRIIRRLEVLSENISENSEGSRRLIVVTMFHDHLLYYSGEDSWTSERIMAWNFSRIENAWTMLERNDHDALYRKALVVDLELSEASLPGGGE